MINPFSALTSKIFALTTVCALTFGAIQTARIEGFLFIDGYIDKLEDRDKTIRDMEKASDEARAAALANAERVKREYQEISDNAKQDYAGKLADNRAAIERWKLQNRRGPTDQGDSATASDIPTGVAGAEALPLIPRGFVILPESDLDKTADIQATLAALQQAARKVQAVSTVPAKSGEVQE